AYAGTPQGRTIERWLKASETSPAEPAPPTATAETPPPKPPEPAAEAPPGPKPSEPAPAEPAGARAPAPPRRPTVPAGTMLREAEAAYQKAFRPDQAKSAAEKAKLARALLTAAASTGARDA